MPLTKNQFSHLYRDEDWSSHERIVLAPRTRVALTGVSSGEGNGRYWLAWASVPPSQIAIGWIWEGHLDSQTMVRAIALRSRYPDLPKNYKLYYSRRTRFYKNDLISKLEAIQQLLADEVFVSFALNELEQRTFSLSKQYKHTTALDMALDESERRWVSGPRMTLRWSEKPKKESTRHPGETTLVSTKGPYDFAVEFLSRAVKKAVPIRDIGAPVFHGEYAHRLQWYIISFYFAQAWSPAGLRYVHHAMGRKRFLQALSKPAREEDAWRSLWDCVLDVRLNEVEELGHTDDVYAAKPAMVTSRLLGYFGSPEERRRGKLAKLFPTIARAVTNKQRKRQLEELARKNKKQYEELDEELGWKLREQWALETLGKL